MARVETKTLRSFSWRWYYAPAEEAFVLA